MASSQDQQLKQQIDEAQRRAEAGDFGGIPAIAAGIESANPDVRVKAAAAAGRIGAPALVEPLARMVLEDQDGPNRSQAAYALAAVGTPAVVPPLIDAVGDPDPERANDARTALFYVLGYHVAPMLRADEFDDVDEDAAEDDGGAAEVDALGDWWAQESERFEAERTYAFGEPAHPARVVDEIERQGPALPDAYIDTLEDWTGADFGRDSIAGVVARMRQWLAEHADEFEPGRRYFRGHRVPSV